MKMKQQQINQTKLSVIALSTVLEVFTKHAHGYTCNTVELNWIELNLLVILPAHVQPPIYAVTTSESGVPLPTPFSTLPPGARAPCGTEDYPC